jgi:hypothetical protein
MQVILIFISGLTFIFYGLLCLFTNHMKAEFERYGLSQFRMLTGILELLGGIGLLLGLSFVPLLLVSCSGLALLMFLGVIVRLKTKDPLIQILPAFILMLINLQILLNTV